MNEKQWKAVVEHAEFENFKRTVGGAIGLGIGSLLLAGLGIFWIYNAITNYWIERKTAKIDYAIKAFWSTNESPICYYFDGKSNNIYTREGWRIHGFPPDGVDRQWVMSSNEVVLWTGNPVKINWNPNSFWGWL